MKVEIRLFASYKEHVGASQLTLELPRHATVGYLAEEMLRRYPNIAIDPARLLVAVNHEYQDHLYSLDDGDEVALIPPVSGGYHD